VKVDVGVGEVTLKVEGRVIEGSGLIGYGLDWSDGPGRACMEIGCDVGSIDVRLN